MIGKKINYICRAWLSIGIILFSFISLHTYAEESGELINITVFPRVTINEHFYGFGVETLPWLWTKENKEMGINEDDIRLNLERIRDMTLPITRIFVPWETWNPSVDYKTFTWESDEMRSLYKTLDLYQEMGTQVILVTVDWLKDSPWANVEDSAQAVLAFLEYLVKNRGYSCIKFWTLTNEPELTYGWLSKMPFENYVQVHSLIREGLKKRRLSVKIIGSDEVCSQMWFEKSARSLYSVADVFSSHAYFLPQETSSIYNFLEGQLNIIKKSSFAKRGIPFFLCEFGFRGKDFGACSNSLIEDYDYGVYTANLCIDALNLGVDSASLWCLHQIRLIDEINPEGGKIMRIGLWAYKDKNWQTFPIYYLYRLFTKYIKPGSRILKVKVSPDDALKVACVEYDGKYSLFIANLSDREQFFLIKWNDFSKVGFRKFIYNRTEFSTLGEDLPVLENPIEDGNYLRDKISPSSVILYTNLR